MTASNSSIRKLAVERARRVRGGDGIAVGGCIPPTDRREPKLRLPPPPPPPPPPSPPGEPLPPLL